MKVFFGGVPTGADVRKLIDAFGTPAPGDQIGHDEIAQVIGVDRKSARYRTVTLAWRKELLTRHNTDLACVSGEGYRALTDAERVAAGLKGTRYGMRKIVRGIKRVDVVRTDDPVLLQKQEVARRMGAVLTQSFNEQVRSLEPPRPAEQQPRVVPMPKRGDAAA